MGIIVLPDETYTPLHVNGNAMLSCTIALQSVESVARRIAKIVQAFGGIEHTKACISPLNDVRWQLAAALAVPDFLCFGIYKGADHLPRPTWTTSKVNVATAAIVLMISNAVMVASYLAQSAMTIYFHSFLLRDFHQQRLRRKADLERRV
jgi:hypothetical protein